MLKKLYAESDTYFIKAFIWPSRTVLPAIKKNLNTFKLLLAGCSQVLPNTKT